MTDDERCALEVARIHERALANWRCEAEPLSQVSLTHCLACGNAIPQQRQRAVPGVTLCVACKQAEEVEAKRWAT